MNNYGITINIDEIIFNNKMDSLYTTLSINNEIDLKENNDLKLCEIYTNNNLKYLAIDDVFKSASGKYYIDVYINNTFVKMNIENISYVYDLVNNSPSFLSLNLNNIKEQIKRNDKIDRILDE